MTLSSFNFMVKQFIELSLTKNQKVYQALISENISVLAVWLSVGLMVVFE